MLYRSKLTFILPAADSAGWVDVDKSTTQHNKYKNIFSIGDASSLPNSKTAAAITAQVPVMIDNLLATMAGKELKAGYDGYASCPLLTGHNELMLCEFKYGGVPKETFAHIFGGQETPSALFYYLKKNIFVSTGRLESLDILLLQFGANVTLAFRLLELFLERFVVWPFSLYPAGHNHESAIMRDRIRVAMKSLVS